MSTFGIIFGLGLCFIAFISQKFLIEKVYKLRYLALDKPFLGKNSAQRYNLMINLVLEDFDPDKLKKHIIEKGIKKNTKLTSYLVYKFFDYYWKVEENPTKREQTIENAFLYKEIPSENGLIEYAQKELQNHVDFLNKEKLPYEIHLVKFRDSARGGVLFKCDHVISDGLGLVGFICAISDNYTEDIFHPLLRGKKFTILHELIGFILFPYYLIRVTLRVVFNKIYITPFKKYFDTPKNKHTGRTLLAVSEARLLSNYEKARKSLKISFNDLTVSVILSSLKKHFKDVKSMNFALPFGKTGIPKSIEEVEIYNKSGGIFLELPLIESVEKESPIIHKILIKELKDIFNASCSNILFRLMVEFLPYEVLNYISDMTLNKVDLIHSNLPGPMNYLYFSGSKVVDILPLISNGRAKVVLPVFSYHRKFRVFVAYDESVGLDPKEILKTIENEFDEIERKYHIS
jgi:hypothetical protein